MSLILIYNFPIKLFIKSMNLNDFIIPFLFINLDDSSYDKK